MFETSTNKNWWLLITGREKSEEKERAKNKKQRARMSEETAYARYMISLLSRFFPSVEPVHRLFIFILLTRLTHIPLQ